MVRDLIHQSTNYPTSHRLTRFIRVIVHVQPWGIDKRRHFGVFSLFSSKLMMGSVIVHVPVPGQSSPDTVSRQTSDRRCGETRIAKKLELLGDSVKTRTSRQERWGFLGGLWSAWSADSDARYRSDSPLIEKFIVSLLTMSKERPRVVHIGSCEDLDCLELQIIILSTIVTWRT